MIPLPRVSLSLLSSNLGLFPVLIVPWNRDVESAGEGALSTAKQHSNSQYC